VKIFLVQENVYRGECPEGFEDLLTLNSRGIDTWLHIENGFQRMYRWAFGAQDWQVRLRNRYVYMPFSNIRFPDKNVLAYCASLIHAHATCGGPAIYVCCKHGRDRTGIVMGYWRVVHCGWTPEAAWNEVRAYRIHNIYLWLGWEKKFYKLFGGV
jgi:protein tyrosine/serine phosphatase